MPKQKRHSGAKKRFKVTGGGKIMRQSTGLRHRLASKNRKTKLGKRGRTEIAAADYKRATEMLSA